MSDKLRNMTGIYIINNDRMLLLFRIGSRVVAPSWCSIGGHFEEGELNDPKDCVLRELSEETVITEADINNLTMKYITLRNKNQEIRQNYYFFAELKNTDINISFCNEGILEWVDIDQVLEREMPFTAKEVVKHYLTVGRYDNKLYAGAAAEGKVIFSELDEF